MNEWKIEWYEQKDVSVHNLFPLRRLRQEATRKYTYYTLQAKAIENGPE